MRNVFDACLPKSAKRAFWWGFVSCLIIGLCIILVVPSLFGMSTEFGGRHHDGYLELATNLLHGNGFVFEPGGARVTHRPPMPVFFMVPVVALPHDIQRAGLVLLQSILVGLGCACLFDMARRLFSTKVASLSVLLFMFYPWIYWHVKNPMSIILHTACVLLVMNLIIREWCRPVSSEESKQAHWVLRSLVLGFAMGIAVLSHGTLVLSITLLAGMMSLLALYQRRRQSTLVFATSLVLAGLVVIPWTYRNWVVAHRFIPVVSNAGYAYFYGVWFWEGDATLREMDPYRGALVVAGIDREPETVFHYSGIKSSEIEDELSKKMVQHLSKHPGQFCKKIALNSAYYYLPALKYIRTPKNLFSLSAIEQYALSGWHLGIWSLAVFGLWKNRGTTIAKSGWLLLAIVFLLALPYMPFLVMVGHNQYVLPTIPLVAMIAATGIVKVPTPKKTSIGSPHYDAQLEGKSNLHSEQYCEA